MLEKTQTHTEDIVSTTSLSLLTIQDYYMPYFCLSPLLYKVTQLPSVLPFLSNPTSYIRDEKKREIGNDILKRTHS